jgi:hypothetical protein
MSRALTNERTAVSGAATNLFVPTEESLSVNSSLYSAREFPDSYRSRAPRSALTPRPVRRGGTHLAFPAFRGSEPASIVGGTTRSMARNGVRRDRLQAAADRMGVSLSTWIRLRAVAGASR